MRKMTDSLIGVAINAGTIIAPLEQNDDQDQIMAEGNNNLNNNNINDSVGVNNEGVDSINNIRHKHNLET